MGKKQKEESTLGKCLLKDKRGRKKNLKNSMRHVAELNDGTDFSSMKFKSVTEQTDIDSFLATAELAGIDFKAQKLDLKIIPRSTVVGVLTNDEKAKIKKLHDDNKAFLRIPRRPPWDRNTSAEELAAAERSMFLEWRRDLSLLQEKEQIVMTPYEKNIEFWRQLWRVIEKSDVVVQIVDARNPLLFYCEDLSEYVKEVDCHKENLILVNKADFLTEPQRKEWVRYFDGAGLRMVFFSAIEESLPVIEEESSSIRETEDDLHHLNNLNVSSDGNDSTDFELSVRECQNDLEHLSKIQIVAPLSHSNHVESEPVSAAFHFANSPKLLNRKEFVEVLTHFHTGPKLNHAHVTIGLVGYPNVGKSSTINSLLQMKRTSVSATPGKTKHFQTLFLNDDVLLCDCPGLVFPAFVATKEEMIISGILPIDQMRDHIPPINLVLSQIPRNWLEETYGVRIPLPLEGEDPDRNPTSEEFLNAYGYMRGFMTGRGTPDNPRASRYILKDYICGKILYCHCPPGGVQEDYHQFVVQKVRKTNIQPTPQQISATSQKITSIALDDAFFNQKAGLHYSGRINMKLGQNIPPVEATGGEDVPVVQKPWKMMLKEKRNSRQKARKKYAELDL